MNTPKVGRSKRAKVDRTIQFHSDGCGQEAHPAVNVKVYDRLCDLNGDSTEAQQQAAWDCMVEEWWEQATEIAHDCGYSCVFSEGRSSGWCVPFYQTLADGRSKFHNWPGQGGGMGYPRYPDVEGDKRERARFLKFQAMIRKLLADVPNMYKWHLDSICESERAV